MQIWIVYYLPNVGDYVVEKIFNNELSAKEYVYKKQYPNQFDIERWPVDG